MDNKDSGKGKAILIAAGLLGLLFTVVANLLYSQGSVSKELIMVTTGIWIFCYWVGMVIAMLQRRVRTAFAYGAGMFAAVIYLVVILPTY